MIVKSVSAMQQEYKRTIYVEGGVREAPPGGSMSGDTRETRGLRSRSPLFGNYVSLRECHPL
jgi:hypothetical protein